MRKTLAGLATVVAIASAGVSTASAETIVVTCRNSFGIFPYNDVPGVVDGGASINCVSTGVPVVGRIRINDAHFERRRISGGPFIRIGPIRTVPWRTMTSNGPLHSAGYGMTQSCIINRPRAPKWYWMSVVHYTLFFSAPRRIPAAVNAVARSKIAALPCH